MPDSDIPLHTTEQSWGPAASNILNRANTVGNDELEAVVRWCHHHGTVEEHALVGHVRFALNGHWNERFRNAYGRVTIDDRWKHQGPADGQHMRANRSVQGALAALLVPAPIAAETDTSILGALFADAMTLSDHLASSDGRLHRYVMPLIEGWGGSAVGLLEAATILAR